MSVLSHVTNRVRAVLSFASGSDAGTLAAAIRTDPVGTTAQPVTLPTGGGKTLAFALISQGGIGQTAVVAAQTAKKIKVVSYVVVMDTAGATFKFQSAGTSLTGAMPCAQYGGAAVLGDVTSHLLETATGEALNIFTTGGLAFGHISYFAE